MQQQEEQFFKLPTSLMSAHGYVSPKTGEHVKLSQGAKFVYLYLKTRNEFFLGQKKGGHFESQQTIADAVGMSLRMVNDILNEFINEGVVVANKEKCSNGKRWNYKKVLMLKLWVKGSDGKPEDVKKIFIDAEKRSVHNSTQKPKQDVIIPMLGEDFDSPF